LAFDDEPWNALDFLSAFYFERVGSALERRRSRRDFFLRRRVFNERFVGENSRDVFRTGRDFFSARRVR